jgi:hypothetical protein
MLVAAMKLSNQAAGICTFAEQFPGSLQLFPAR